MNFEKLKSSTADLDENEININFFYKSPGFLRRILGLQFTSSNGHESAHALRFQAIDGSLPALTSYLYYLSILCSYIIQKLKQRYIVKNPKPFIVTDAAKFILNWLGFVSATTVLSPQGRRSRYLSGILNSGG